MSAPFRRTIHVDLPILHQDQVNAYLLPGRFKAIRCGRRWGKALALDTPIPTSNGWKAMGDLDVGDCVFGDDGKPCHVTFVSEVMINRECFDVVFSDGSRITADAEHGWSTWDKRSRKNIRRGQKGQRGGAVSPKVRTTMEIAASLRVKDERNHSIECCAPIECGHMVYGIPPYVLGVWLGDGHTGGSSFTSNDPQIAEELRREGQPVHKSKAKYAWSTADRMKESGFAPLQTRLKSLGVIGNKHIPTAYLRGSILQRLALLQGLMDTDGYVSGANGQCEYVSVSRRLADDVFELVLSMGIKATMSVGDARLYGRYISPKYRIKFSTDISVFRLKRKADRLYRKRKFRIDHRFIEDVIPVPSVPVRCIQVDNKSHLYLAGRSFISTHNTDLGKTVAGDDISKGKFVGWFAPDYKRISEAFLELVEIIKPIRYSSSKVDKVIRTISGGRADFWTLDDPLAGRSRMYHTVIIDEAAFTGKEMMDTWSKSILPTLLDFTGRCLVLSNTNGIDPENFFWRICNQPEHGFVQYHAPTFNNPHVPRKMPNETDADYALRRQETYDQLRRDNHPLVYQQEYLAEFVDWSGTAFFELAKMLVDGKPVPVPPRLDTVFAVIDTATKTGQENDGTGVIYFGYTKYAPVHPLVILDYDYAQIEGSLLETWLPTVFAKLDEFTKTLNARSGSSGAWIEDKSSGMVLLQSAMRKGMKVHAIDSKLTSVGKVERAIAVSSYVFKGDVKISEFAFNKVVPYKGAVRNHMVAQIVGFRVGSKERTDDDLLDSFSYGLSIALGNQQGF